MSNQTLQISGDLYRYILDSSIRESDIQQRLREETAMMPEHNMQISPEQGQFMALLVRLMQAKNIIEIGTFTGYSALCMALAMPDDGKMICCDISSAWAELAQRYWAQAKIEHKIALRLAPAQETLLNLVAEGKSGSFDLAFIDADKENYQQYFELCLALLRSKGLILIDNTLWGGAVIDDADQSSETKAIRLFNGALLKDRRVEISLLPISDGLTLAVKH